MKKFLSSFVLCLFGVINAFGYDFETGGIYYNILSDLNNTCEVTFLGGEYGSKYTGEITIPSSVSYDGKEYTVVGIGYHAFYRCSKTNFTKITLPNTIEDIGDYAFFEDEGLTEIDLPANLRSIGEGAFGWCKNIIGNVEIPSNVITIGGRGFEGCKGITSIILGNKCESIGKQAFYSCNLLESINFPSSLKTIGESAFSGCESLSDVVFEEGLTEIGRRAFYGCKKISKISTPSSLVSIGNEAFADCSNISELTFANGLQSIGEYAFKGCVKLTSLRLPDSVLSIGKAAFTGASSGNGKAHFEEVCIGNGLSEIVDVFQASNTNHPSIEKLIVGNSITKLYEGSNIFYEGAFSYLLTNNVVQFNDRTSLGYTHSPSCTIFVADSTKYTAANINKYRLRNIVSTSSFVGEYSGKEPNLNIKSNLNDYDILLDQNSKNVGTYSSVKITFTKDDFSSTISVPCSYTITKAPLNIIANDKVVYYGEEIPELDCSYIGFKNAETAENALSALPTMITSAKKESPAGIYTINVSGAEARNYSLSYTNGTLTIKKALQEITWNQTFSDCFVDDEIELNATSSSGLPITYTSSDQSIAFVTTENGKQVLHLIKDGVVKISAIQSGNGNYEAAQEISKSIKVIARVASSISLSKSSAALKEGESITLYAAIIPESVIEKGVAWSSSDNNVATVNNGVVTAIKVGNAIITATTIDGSNLSASCNITVEPVLATSISLDKNYASVKVGESLTLTPTIKPDNTTYKAVDWVSSNTNVAIVENGIVLAKNVGTADITVATTDGTNLSATCKINVDPILATSITISDASLNMEIGQSAILSVSISPDDVTSKEIDWSSSNNSIAMVSNGNVTAVSSGTCTIKAKTTDGSNLEAICTVTVADILVSTLSIDKQSLQLFVEDEAVITATTYPSNATNSALAWSSSNASVATVNNGRVKAIGAGEAVISVRTTDGTDKVANCSVIVKKHVQTISWKQDFSNVVSGGELIELTAKSSSDLPITYSSSNDNVAVIFDMGNIIYLNPVNPGTASITATQAGNDYYEPASMTKIVKVVAPDGIEQVAANAHGKYIVYTIKGLYMGEFTDEELAEKAKVLARGVYLINGKKLVIK